MVHLYFNFFFTKMNTVSRSLSAAADNVDGILTAVNAVLFIVANASQVQYVKLFTVASRQFEIVCIEKPEASLDFHFTQCTETKYNWMLKVRHIKYTFINILLIVSFSTISRF